MVDDNSPTGIWDISTILGTNPATPDPVADPIDPPSVTTGPAWTADPVIEAPPAADSSPALAAPLPPTTATPRWSPSAATPADPPWSRGTEPEHSGRAAAPIHLPPQLERPVIKERTVKPAHVGIAAAIVVALCIAIGIATSGGKSPASASAQGTAATGFGAVTTGPQQTYATVGPTDGSDDGTSPSDSSDPSAGSVGGFTGPSASAAPSASPTVDSQAAALAELRRIRNEDTQYVSFDGQYVAQIASKSVGIADPLQIAANGTHTFYATDILAEHLRLRHGDNLGARVVLVLSTDYGKQQLIGGEPLWVTFALSPDFQTAQDVHDWCSQRFPTLSTRRLKNHCDVRTLEPIGD
jgi:hypothetical protein